MPLTQQYEVVLVACEEGGFSAFVPALRGCWSEGDTEAETLENIRDAIHEYLEAIREAYPKESLRLVAV